MAWKTVNVETQRNLLIQDYFAGKFTITDLCKQYSISRPTFYKWLNEYQIKGPQGLQDRSRVPLISPNATPEPIERQILAVKYEWSKWGPKKVLGYLKNHYPEIIWPCKTTVENILKKHGLVKKRKLRRRFACKSDPLGECNDSNSVWCIDFKGWWFTSDQQKCEPFTVMDAYSRYLLCCQKLIANDNQHVWAIFERLFRENGLPSRVRSDNGSPFATHGAGRLSRLSINLIKANVIPEWIEPGEPQQNGRHERMHLTLKNEGVFLDFDLEKQSVKLDEFLNYYNFIRPHEALEQKCPGNIYQPSNREWNGRLRSPEYDSDFVVGKVKSCGKMSIFNRDIYVGRVFEGEPIGLKKDEGIIKAYYGPIYLGVLKDNTLEFERRPGRKKVKI